MLKKFGLLATLLFPAFLLLGCGDLPESTSNVTSRYLTNLSISPTSASVPVGGSISFSATAYFSDGTTAPIIPSWSATNNLGTITTAGYSGIFVATQEGTGSVTASYGDMAASASITVTAEAITYPGGLTTIEVSPRVLHATVGYIQVFTAAGTNASGESVEISPAWSMTGDPIGVLSWSGTVATLKSTGEGVALISCASGEAYASDSRESTGTEFARTASHCGGAAG